MRQLTIALDADGVLFDIMTPWLTVYNHFSGDSLKVEDITDWDVRKFVKPAYREVIYDFRLPECYDAVQPLPGSLTGVDALLRMGHRLVVVTHEYGSHREAKQAALHHWFPDLKNVVFAKNKRDVVRADFYVDDYQGNLPDLLLTQPWNASYACPFGMYRVADWEAIPIATAGYKLYWGTN
jgi:5'(3')-deoxyribonucleotidase